METQLPSQQSDQSIMTQSEKDKGKNSKECNYDELKRIRIAVEGSLEHRITNSQTNKDIGGPILAYSGPHLPHQGSPAPPVPMNLRGADINKYALNLMDALYTDDELKTSSFAQWENLPPVVETKKRGNGDEDLEILLGSANITLLDCFSPLATNPDTTTSGHNSPGVCVAIQPQLSTSATVLPAPAPTQPLAKVTKRRRCSPEVVHLLEMLAPTPEESMVPPPPTLKSLLHAQPFAPGKPGTSMRIERLNEVPPLWEGVAPDTSPPTPTPSPVHNPPQAAVSARQHLSLRVSVATDQLLPASPVAAEQAHPTPPGSSGPPPPIAKVTGPSTRSSIVLDNLDETMRLPFYRELEPLAGRQLGTFEWVAFEEVLCRWSAAIKEVVNKQQQRPSNPTSHWARRQRRLGSRPGARPPSPNGAATSPPTAPSPEPGRTDGQETVRCLLQPGPTVFCKIGDEDLVEHFNAAYSTQPPLGPPHLWLFPPGNSDAPVETAEGDVLAEPFSPEEVVGQFRRTKRSAPGVDGITYANWRWVDPLGTILAIIFNVCRLNKKVPSAWKHSTVTLIHKGGNVASVRNWRTISLQLNIYKLYSALIAQQIGSWAVQTAAFSPSQKGFLAYDGCAEHNFLLRSMLTDSRRGKRNLALAWLDLREAFRSVHHNLLSLMMERMGLSGPIRENTHSAWATSKSAFSPSQKCFLAYDGCAEHNFLLRSMLTDSRQKKRDLLLTWLDLREVFPSVSHDLLSLMMERLGLSGGPPLTLSGTYTPTPPSPPTARHPTRRDTTINITLRPLAPPQRPTLRHRRALDSDEGPATGPRSPAKQRQHGPDHPPPAHTTTPTPAPPALGCSPQKVVPQPQAERGSWTTSTSTDGVHPANTASATRTHTTPTQGPRPAGQDIH
ncbi:hypothetical protein EMCRGX_G005469 [Ephydatia muelleri]